MQIADRPAQKDIRALKPIFRFLKPYRTRIIFAAIALVFAATSVLAMGQGLRRVIDQGFMNANPSLLDQALGVSLVVVAVLALATYARFYLVSWVGERLTADLRRAVFSHLLKLSPGFFEVTRTGEVISRLTNDTALIEIVVGSSASIALRNILLLIGGLIMLAITSSKLALFVVLGVPLTVAPILLYGRRVRKLSRATQDRVADISAYIDETLHEIRTVQAYGHEPQDSERFGERVEATFATGLKRIRQRALLTAIVIMLVFGAVGVILWVGGHDVLDGKISAGQLSAFVFYSILVAGAVGAISEVVGDLQRAAGAAERLMELLATEPQIRAPANPVPLPESAKGEVSFNNVTFCYPSRPDIPALKDFSLAVKSGERLALVGPSGGGKTTVFQLLLRYYDPQQGVVRMDGVDLPLADPLVIRSHIALVPQDPVIFAGSVFDNVRYGRTDASDSDVHAALEAAYATDFVNRLPDGGNTFLGERGTRLSGGQRQRIAIARAILADRPLLLLDEATSALDSESERMVQLALERLASGRTTIIIAHRLATVQSADRIAVLDHGQIVSIGTHANLMRENGLYARLAVLQFDVRMGV
ncbi:MAG: ABC transporter transmembrane domain-containing protein [Pseudomonadota bacterium]